MFSPIRPSTHATPLLLVGTVSSTQDTLGLGRVTVDVDYAGQTLKLPWLRVLQPLADGDGGTFLLPEKNSTVVVLCGAGSEPAGMIVLGALYNGNTKPKLSDATGTNDVKQILTRGGNQLTITDTTGKESILVQTKDASIKILLDAKLGMTIEAQGDISVASKTGKLTIAALDKLSLSGGDVEIKATGKLDITATGPATLKGAEASVTGDTRAVLKGGGSVEATAAGVTLTGTMVEVK